MIVINSNYMNKEGTNFDWLTYSTNTLKLFCTSVKTKYFSEVHMLRISCILPAMNEKIFIVFIWYIKFVMNFHISATNV